MRTMGLLQGTSYLVIFCIIADISCSEATYCAYSKKDTVKFNTSPSSYDDGDVEPFLTGELLDGNTTEKCPSTNNCYALWQEDYNNKNATVFIAQGCWSAAELDCKEDACISTKKPQKAVNNTTTKFCCCKGNMCNVNVSDGFFPAEENEAAPRFVEHASFNPINIVFITVACVIIVLVPIIGFLIYRACSTSQKPSPDSVHLMEPPLPPSPVFNIDNLTICESIGRGRYGRVFRGTLFNQSVAVKIFSSQHRQNYLNERYIYCLSFMDHDSIPKLLGAEERTGPDERPEYLLVL